MSAIIIRFFTRIHSRFPARFPVADGEGLRGVASRGNASNDDAVGLAIGSEVNRLILLPHHAAQQNAFAKRFAPVRGHPKGRGSMRSGGGYDHEFPGISRWLHQLVGGHLTEAYSCKAERETSDEHGTFHEFLRGAVKG